MARPPLLPLLLALLLLPPVLPLPSPPPGNASVPACPAGSFQCQPGDRCFPVGWLCDGHPDCRNGADELHCGTATPAAEPSPGAAWASPPWSSAGLPTGSAEAPAVPASEDSVPPRAQGCSWILLAAVLLSLLAAAGSLAVWGMSKAKSSSDTFSPEKASREQLVPDKSRTGSFP